MIGVIGACVCDRLEHVCVIVWSMCVTAPNRFEQCAPLVRVFDGRCIFHSVTDNMIDDVFDHSRKAPKHESCLRVT